MNTNRSCGCKSFNSCYTCEKEFGIKPKDPAQDLVNQYPKSKTLCFQCYGMYPTEQCHNCKEFKTSNEMFSGINIIQDFVTEEEENELISSLDDLPWDVSQSGRRKQNFGPRANFKKRKVKVGPFKGFPKSTKFIQDRFSTVPMLEDYKTVEQCSIEYRPETGARIDPHIDDCWVWGERIVQLNLLSDSFLTLIPFQGDEKTPSRYNLPDVKNYPRILNCHGDVQYNPFRKDANWNVSTNFQVDHPAENYSIRIPLPRRSLLVLFGNPRYNWEHCILRKDIESRRIVIAYRELTPPYLPNGPDEIIGRDILEKAAMFF